MTDLAPDGRERLAGKKGTDIGEVRGEGAIFCGKRSGARLVRRGSSRSIAAKADRERKAQDAFAEKERRVGRECPHAGGGFLREKERAYIGRSGREQSGRRYMQRRRPRARSAQVPTERIKPPFGRRFYEKQNPDRSGFRIGIGWPASPPS